MIREAEEVIRIHRRMYKNELNDLDNHDGVVIHLESDILECEVKWILSKHYYEQS